MKPLYGRILTFLSGAPNYGPGAIPDVGDSQVFRVLNKVNLVRLLNIIEQKLSAFSRKFR
jgi:hypothetical protein